MHRRGYVLWSCGCLLITAFAYADGPPADLVTEAENSFICGFKEGLPPGSAPGLVDNLKAQGLTQVRHVYHSAFNGFSTSMAATAVARLMENNSAIAFCEANGLGQAGGIPASAGAKGGAKGKPDKEPPAQITPWGVTAVGGPADASGKTGRIWIIDSGIADHPDLNVDFSAGRNFLSKGKKTLEDNSGHGTHVAGIAAAIDNDIGVVGVAAGATVVPIKVMHTSYWATIDDMIAGIDYVATVAQPGDVANMSIWAWGHYESLHQASTALAEVIPFIVIAGNDGEDINDRPAEPAHVEHPNLLTVSSINAQSVLAASSNYGSSDSSFCQPDDGYACAQVDAAGPGVAITSLQPDGSLAEWSGTSMAGPHVAAVVFMNGDTGFYGSTFADDDPDSHADPIYVLR